MRCANIAFVRTPLFAKREDNILPYRGRTNFYGFTPKFVLDFVGTDVLGGPLKQMARVIVTAAHVFKGSLWEGAPDEIGWGRVRKGEDSRILMSRRLPQSLRASSLPEGAFW